VPLTLQIKNDLKPVHCGRPRSNNWRRMSQRAEATVIAAPPFGRSIIFAA
jgi:hypothetical protein